MAGVVLIHLTAARMNAAPSFLTDVVNALGRFAVPTFMAVSGYLHAQSIGRSGAPAALRSRMVKLLPAYVVWSAVYLIDASIRTPEAAWDAARVVKVVLLGGANYHLWFVPALMSLQLLGTLASTPRRRAVFVALGIAAALLAVFGPSRIGGFGLWSWLGMGASTFLDRTLVTSLLSYALGMLVSDLSPGERGSGRWVAPLVFALCAVLVVATVWARREASPVWLAENRRAIFYLATLLVAFVTTAAAARGSLPLVGRLAPLAPLSFGVYLLHPFLRTYVLRWFPADSLSGWQWIPLTAVALIGLSGLSTWLLLRIPYVRRTLG